MYEIRSSFSSVMFSWDSRFHVKMKGSVNTEHILSLKRFFWLLNFRQRILTKNDQDRCKVKYLIFFKDLKHFKNVRLHQSYISQGLDHIFSACNLQLKREEVRLLLLFLNNKKKSYPFLAPYFLRSYLVQTLPMVHKY